MQGLETIRFSELFIDTVATHGVQWSATYFAAKRMEVWEFRFWLKSCWQLIGEAQVV